MAKNTPGVLSLSILKSLWHKEFSCLHFSYMASFLSYMNKEMKNKSH